MMSPFRCAFCHELFSLKPGAIHYCHSHVELDVCSECGVKGGHMASCSASPMYTELEVDMVNHPPHYTQGGIECIEAIRAALTPEEFRGFCKGNAIKYVWRELHKGGDESLEKSAWYLRQLTNVKAK